MPDLESVWAHREEIVYKELFGDTGQGIYTLTAETFELGFNVANVDPRWLFLGVFESAPNDKHSSWLYVSSGLSNPWEDEPSDYDKNEWSGMGVEFVMETPSQSQWAITLLHRMIAYNILLAAGGKPPLAFGGRIGSSGSIVPGQESELTTLMIAKPDHYPSTFKLDSGAVDFMHFIGITAPELEFAKASSSADLLARLKQGGVYPLTDPSRKSIPL